MPCLFQTLSCPQNLHVHAERGSSQLQTAGADRLPTQLQTAADSSEDRLGQVQTGAGRLQPGGADRLQTGGADQLQTVGADQAAGTQGAGEQAAK